MDELTECAFEPDVTEIRCVDCGKRTGETGTCKDVGLCADCREVNEGSLIAQGFTPEEAKTSVSEMLITMIEGRGYNSKFKPRRVLHYAPDGKPVCGIRGGPHPMTGNPNASNCKRCIKAHTRVS